MSELISKQAAIDAVMDEFKRIPTNAIRAKIRIAALPPAQPEKRTEECTETHACDCISRQQAIDEIDEWIKAFRENGHKESAADACLIQDGIIQLPLAQPEPCEDAVSRTEILRMINCINDHHAITPYKSVGAVTEHLTRIASSLPPVTPKRGKCKWCERLKERNLRIEYYWIDQEGCTASFSEPHIVATGIAKFCPNCGAKITEGDAE